MWLRKCWPSLTQLSLHSSLQQRHNQGLDFRHGFIAVIADCSVCIFSLLCSAFSMHHSSVGNVSSCMSCWHSGTATSHSGDNLKSVVKTWLNLCANYSPPGVDGRWNFILHLGLALVIPERPPCTGCENIKWTGLLEPVNHSRHTTDRVCFTIAMCQEDADNPLPFPIYRLMLFKQKS